MMKTSRATNRIKLIRQIEDALALAANHIALLRGSLGAGICWLSRVGGVVRVRVGGVRGKRGRGIGGGAGGGGGRFRVGVGSGRRGGSGLAGVSRHDFVVEEGLIGEDFPFFSSFLFPC